MRWQSRHSVSGSWNGWQYTHGIIHVEVFRDFGTREWVLTISGLKVREVIGNSGMVDHQVILSAAEKELRKQVIRLQRQLSLTVAEINKTRKQ